jgi:hypothetical protein
MNGDFVVVVTFITVEAAHTVETLITVENVY